jgi:hypothetical protein
MNSGNGDVILFWLTCVLLGVILAYVVASHMTGYWCGGNP